MKSFRLPLGDRHALGTQVTKWEALGVASVTVIGRSASRFFDGQPSFVEID